MIEDITPQRSVAPVILDDSPQEPVSDPLPPPSTGPTVGSVLVKLANNEQLTKEDMAVLEGLT